MSGGKGPMFLSKLAQSPPSTYSMTIQRCFLVSKLQYIETTKGLSVNDMISLSAKTWSTWFLSIKFCLLIFFRAKRCRVSLCLTRYTAPYAPLEISLITSKSSSEGSLNFGSSLLVEVVVLDVSEESSFSEPEIEK